MDFLFPFNWEIRKRICKTVLINSGVLFVNYACMHAFEIQNSHVCEMRSKFFLLFSGVLN